MRIQSLLTVVALLAGAHLALAQEVAPPAGLKPPPANPPAAAVPNHVAPPGAEPAPFPAHGPNGNGPQEKSTMEWPAQGPWAPQSRVWFSAEYLLWWLKSGEIPPVVGTAPGSLAGTGRLPPDAITVLFGDPVRRIDYDEGSGFRLTAGAWLDPHQIWGGEISYFQMERQPTHLAFGSGGNPILGQLFINAPDNILTIITSASPATADAGPRSAVVTLDTINRFWGIEANARTEFTLFSDRSELIFGFRHLQYDESLRIASSAQFLPGSGILTGLRLNDYDQFGTQNQFYGPQVGFMADRYCGCVFFNLQAKIALGWVHQEVDIQGNTIADVAQIPGQNARELARALFRSRENRGGVLALPTNIGQRNRDVFAAVPELTLTTGVQVNSRLRATIGYNLIYITNVARPGSQIDSVDERQIPGLAVYDPAAVVTRPQFAWQSRDFWAQGINFGLEFRY